MLQRDAKAAVTGSVPVGYGVPPMTITLNLVQEQAGLAAADAVAVTVAAVVRADLTWKALLPPRAAFGNYTLTAACTAGCPGSNGTATTITLVNLTFGDVYVCR